MGRGLKLGGANAFYDLNGLIPPATLQSFIPKDFHGLLLCLATYFCCVVVKIA